MAYYTIKDGKTILRVLLQPGAKADEIVGEHDGELKIRLKAPATEGKANTALIKFLAKQFNIPPSKITLQKGHQARHKTIEISLQNTKIINLPFKNAESV